MSYEPEFIRTNNFTAKGQMLVSPNAGEVEAISVPDGHVVVGDSTARLGFTTQEASGGVSFDTDYVILTAEALWTDEETPFTTTGVGQNYEPSAQFALPGAHVLNNERIFEPPSWMEVGEGDVLQITELGCYAFCGTATLFSEGDPTALDAAIMLNVSGELSSEVHSPRLPINEAGTLHAYPSWAIPTLITANRFLPDFFVEVGAWSGGLAVGAASLGDVGSRLEVNLRITKIG